MSSEIIGNKSTIPIVGVCLDRQTWQVLGQITGANPGHTLATNVEHYLAADREVARVASHATATVCIIDFDHDVNDAAAAAERVRRQSSSTYIFAAATLSQPDLIIAAMRAGCSEYLLKPLQSEQLTRALANIDSKQKEKAISGARGRVITVLGAKGGTGVTSLALHLALRLAAPKRKCLLVDQHAALGDASLYLGSGRHQYSFYELACSAERLDRDLLDGFLLHHDSGLDVLDSPEAQSAIHHAPTSAIEQTISFLAEIYPHVVVDCPPGLTDETLATLAQSDQLAIVITAELPAIRNAVRCLEYLTHLGYPEANTKIVLNRHSKRGPLSDEQVEKALRRPVSLRIPNSYAEVIRAINSGTPIMAGEASDFGAAVQRWADEFTGKATKTKAASAGSRSGFMGLLGL